MKQPASTFMTRRNGLSFRFKAQPGKSIEVECVEIGNVSKMQPNKTIFKIEAVDLDDYPHASEDKIVVKNESDDGVFRSKAFDILTESDGNDPFVLSQAMELFPQESVVQLALTRELKYDLGFY